MARRRQRSRGRKSIRLSGYDYSVGAFFITINKSDDGPLFGEIIDGVMYPSAAGRIIMEEWRCSAHIRSQIELDAFVLMPDHLHGIVFFVQPCESASPARRIPRPAGRPACRPAGSGRCTLGSFIGGLKSAATSRAIREGIASGTLWHRGYYERIIRDETALANIRRYIANNPLRWKPRRP